MPPEAVEVNVWGAFFSSLFQIFEWPTIGYMMIGIVIGFWVGILPGIGGAATMALMLPFTFSMSPVAAVAFLLGMYSVTATTGDITSVLFGVPGEGSSAAVIFDGYPMAKQGEAGRALGIVLFTSLIGAVVGAIGLAMVIPFVRPIVLSFGPPEFFMMAVLGLSFVAWIVRAHGGTVDATSRPGKGTTFVVKLPLNPSPPRPEPCIRLR